MLRAQAAPGRSTQQSAVLFRRTQTEDGEAYRTAKSRHSYRFAGLAAG